MKESGENRIAGEACQHGSTKCINMDFLPPAIRHSTFCGLTRSNRVAQVALVGVCHTFRAGEIMLWLHCQPQTGEMENTATGTAARQLGVCNGVNVSKEGTDLRSESGGRSKEALPLGFSSRRGSKLHPGIPHHHRHLRFLFWKSSHALRVT